MSGYEGHRGKLFVVSGPSGAGKGTICGKLLAEADPSELALSISMTTRAPRKGEVDGVSYFFKTKEEFREEIERGGLLEYATVYENYYGTPRHYVEEKLNAGTDVLLEIDIQGAMNVKKSRPDSVFIFVLPPSMDILRERLTNRGTETPEAIELRLSKTSEEVHHITDYDYFVVNDDIDRAVREVKAIFIAEHRKVEEGVSAILEKYEA